MIDLKGQVALVTGGNGGIGLGMARGLARAGADLVIWGRNAVKNIAALEALSAFGGRVVADQVDISDEDAIGQGMAKILERFGRIDTVIASAGIMGEAEKFSELSTSQWRAVLQVNLDAVFWTTREACKHMVQRARNGDPGGSIILVSSTSAIHGAPRHQAYATSKAGLLSLMRGISVEHASHGIRANAVLPGWVRSDMTADLQDWDAFNKKAMARVPVGRWGEPEDFAGIAAYLSSSLSKFHTGDAIVIDGGYTIY